jgi:hypothetical protein
MSSKNVRRYSFTSASAVSGVLERKQSRKPNKTINGKCFSGVA